MTISLKDTIDKKIEALQKEVTAAEDRYDEVLRKIEFKKNNGIETTEADLKRVFKAMRELRDVEEVFKKELELIQKKSHMEQKEKHKNI